MMKNKVQNRKKLKVKKEIKNYQPQKIDSQTLKKITKFLIKKFVNLLTVNGKKEKAEQIFLESLQIIKLLEKKEGILFLFKALENLKPTVELRSIRRGGATYQVPVPSREKRSISLGLKSLIQSAKKKKGSFSSSLAQIIIETSKNLGENIKKRESVDATALKNRGVALLSRF
jgi:small subunit ribosomal protein S7